MRLISQNDLEEAVSGRNVLIDTNIIIYLTDEVSPYAELSRSLFEMVERGEASALLSIVSIAEVMQGPLKKGLMKNAFEVRDYLLHFPNMSCQGITTDVLDSIGLDKRVNWSKLRTIDSLIIASGLINNIDGIVSNDQHFKLAVPETLIISFDL